MAKQINVAMNVSANTTQAKNALNDLQQSLNKISSGINLNISTNNIQTASSAAKELAYHLQNAYNVNTGNIDLSKLQTSLKRSNTDIQTLSSNLLSAGEIGKQAFVQLATAISEADVPILRINSHLSQMWTVMKNTMRWQLSSSALHAFIGSIETAYNYAKDLNESLTNIQIVTGQSSDQMAEFAEQANKAAKALNTTTTAYTDAALIFYQQGLTGEDVTNRTDTVIKLANVTGQSAEDISSQMTAIWNNFDDGTHTLEYYADAITALGATTASSSAEIAEGLEKFASAATTAGLSYEYATSALATVVAATRQSADTVGTAFKTIFARLSDLELGNTLDDDVTLGTYSQALAKIGVQILDTNNDVKDMNTILDETAEKWGNLSNAEKESLAQTVAGTRQYTYFMSLMENWGDMQKNVATAADSTGTLQEQADIYAQSWEAASKKVQAAMESIYSDLLDDKFFIAFNNKLADTINGVDDFIDSIGGLKTVILGLSSVVLSLISNKIQPAFQHLKENIEVLFGKADAAYGKISEDFTKATNKIQANDNLNIEQSTQLTNAQRLLGLKTKLVAIEDTLSDSEKARANLEIQSINLQQQEAEKIANNIVKLKTEIKNTLNEIDTTKLSKTTVANAYSDYGIAKDIADSAYKNWRKAVYSNEDEEVIQELNQLYIDANKNLKLYTQTVNEFSSAQEKLLNSAVNSYNGIIEEGQVCKEASLDWSGYIEIITNLINENKNLSNSTKTTAQDWEAFRSKIALLETTLSDLTGYSPEIISFFEKISNASGPVLNAQLGLLSSQLKKIKINTNSTDDSLELLKTIMASCNAPAQKLDRKFQEMSAEEKKLQEQTERLNQSFKNFKPEHLLTSSEVISKSVSGIMSGVMALNSFKSAMESIEDPDISGWEKWSSVILSTTMGISSFMMTAKNFAPILKSLNILTEASVIASTSSAVATELDTTAEQKNATVTMIAAAKKALKSGANKEEAASAALATITTKGETASEEKLAAASQAAAVAEAELTLATLEFVAAAASIIAIIVLITKAYDNYTNASKKAYESLQESLEQSSENLDEVNSKYEETNNLLTSLDSQRETIADLTYGTIEWAKAVNDLNDDTQTLIDNYNKLSDINLIAGQDYWYDSEGAMQLSTEAKNKIQQQAYSQVVQAQIATHALSYDTNVTAKTQSDIEQLNNDYQSAIVNKSIIQDLYNAIIDGTIKTQDDLVEQLKEKLQVKELTDRQEDLIDALYTNAEATRENINSETSKTASDLLQDTTIKNTYSEIAEEFQTSFLNAIAEATNKSQEIYKQNITTKQIYDTKAEWAKNNGYIEKNGKYYTDDSDSAEEITNINEQIKVYIAKKQAIEDTKDSLKDYYIEVYQKSQEIENTASSIINIWNNVKDSIDNTDQATINTIKDGISEMLRQAGASESIFQNLSTVFIKENSELITSALNGETTALDSLEKKLVSVYNSIPFNTTKLVSSNIGNNIISWNLNSGKSASSSTSTGVGTGKKDKKYEVDEIDRYKKLTDAIEDFETAMNRASKAKDYLYGANRIKYIQQEQNALEQLVQKQQEYTNEAATNLLSDRMILDNKGYGFTYDENGRINNWEEISKKQLDIYNSKLTDEAQTEYELFKKLRDQYDETYDTYQDSLDKQVEYHYELLAKRLENITAEVDLKIQINDEDLKIVEYYTNLLSNRTGYTKGLSSNFTATDSLAQSAKTANIAINQMDAAKEGIRQIQELYQSTGEMTQDMIDKLNEYQDQLTSNTETFESEAINQQELFNQAITESFELIDQDISLLDSLSTTLDNYQKIINLYGRGINVAEAQAKVAEAAAKNALNTLSTTKKEYDLAVTNLSTAKTILDKAFASGNSLLIQNAQQEYDELEALVNEKYQNMLTQQATAAEAAAEQVSYRIQAIFTELEEQYAGTYNTFEELTEAYDRQKTVRDEFLSSSTQTYELSKLTRQINTQIANSDSTVVQNKYRAFLEEINSQYGKIGENGEYINQMSEYDLEYAQKKYELLQAQIALEDTQRAKDTMRLTRGEDGSLRYTYTTNQDNITEAEQNVEDKLYDLQVLSTEYLDNLSTTFTSTLTEWEDAIQKISEDTTLTLEEKQQRLDEINQYYQNRLQYVEEEVTKSYQNLTEDNGNYADNVIITNGKLTIDVENYCNSVQEAMNGSNGVVEAWKDEENILQEAENITGETINTITQTDIPILEQKSTELKEQTKDDTDDMQEYINAVAKTWANWIDDYGKQISEYESDTDKYINIIKNLRDTIVEAYDAEKSAAADAAQAAKDAAAAIASYKSGNNGSGDSSEEPIELSIGDEGHPYTSTTPTKSLENATYVWDGKQLHFSSQNGTIISSKSIIRTNPGIDTISTTAGKTIITGEYTLSELISMLSSGKLSSFDTGGYTGQWGPEGKLATLHEKEIVLNSEDTSNLLSTVGLVRQIAQAIDIQSLYSNISNLVSNGVSTTQSTLNQNVTIQADFPGVQTAAEIEAAFNNLIGQATQYANRRR